jgi:hypothetical protein
MGKLPSAETPVNEARRYLDNARDILSEKAGKDGGYYTDRKYVRMAGNTAWNGVLEAMDELVPAPKKGRRSVEHYQRNIQDGKLLRLFNTAYDLLHLSMGYDGVLKYSVVQDGLSLADEIVRYVETRTAA